MQIGVSTALIPRFTDFTLRVVCDARWMDEQRLGFEAIRSACASAAVRLAGQESGQSLEPCAKCCRTRPKKLITIDGPSLEEPRAGGDGRERVFVFNRCKSNCNSSRLHLGGRVVIVVTVRGPEGPIAEAVSEPLSLVSRTSYVRRPKPPPQIKWVDQSEASDGTGDGEDNDAAITGRPELSSPDEPEKSQMTTAAKPPEPEGTGGDAPAQTAVTGVDVYSEELRRHLEILLQLQKEQLERVRALERLVHTNQP
eukprot:m51a1_g2657 hypothetical protein (254) ;mRNA; r:637757-639151